MQNVRPVSATTTRTTARETVQDDFGNLLWQQEATEFIEKYPLQRRQNILRPSVSVGALNKNATAITTVNKRSSGGELLTTQQRHQRDLFSGDLGIPEIRTHVGSVVHTFETMALQRQREASEAAAAAERDRQQQQQPDHHLQSLSKYTNANVLQYESSSKKYHQLKRKSHEKRQKLSQSQRQNHHYHHQQNPLTNSTMPQHTSTQTLAAQIANAFLASPHNLKQRNTESLMQQSPYGNVNDDYRKNLFGTSPSRNATVESIEQKIIGDVEYGDGCATYDTDEAIIVNAAFDEIFAGYSGEDDDDLSVHDVQMVNIRDFDDEVLKSMSSNSINNIIHPGNIPKNLVDLRRKKARAPPPPQQQAPSITLSSLSATKHTQPNKIAPLATQKQRSTTLTDLFGRLKATQNKRQLTKVPSDSLLRTDVFLPTLHKFPAQLNLHREVEGAEASSYDNNNADETDFLRGSTLSQSFVHQHKNNRSIKQHVSTTSQPPPPPPKPKKQSPKKYPSNLLLGISPVSGVLLFPKRSKSSNALLLDDLNVQIRKYYRDHQNGEVVASNDDQVTSNALGFKCLDRYSVLGNSAEL